MVASKYFDPLASHSLVFLAVVLACGGGGLQQFRSLYEDRSQDEDMLYWERLAILGVQKWIRELRWIYFVAELFDEPKRYFKNTF